jgi:hypothetical protein
VPRRLEACDAVLVRMRPEWFESGHSLAQISDGGEVRIPSAPIMMVVLTASFGPWNTVAAADYSWTASTTLVGGTNRNCGDATIFPRWNIEITGQTLKALPIGAGHPAFASPHTYNLSSLRPDGSGRVIVKSQKGVTIHIDFEPGAGPRKYVLANQNVECRYQVAPMDSR